MRLRNLAMFKTAAKFSFSSFKNFERFEFNFFKKGWFENFLSNKQKGREKIH